jgi:hypothetical protein
MNHPAAANRILSTPDVNDVSWSDWNLIGTGGQTYTFGTTGGTIPTAAGTLTTATANNITAAGVITHAITTTSDGDTTPSTILACDVNGALRVDRFGVGTAAIATTGTIALPNAGYIGNISAARLGFDSAGFFPYAYFLSCWVGFNVSAPARCIEALDATNPQLRLTHTAGVDYVDFQVDTNGILTITPSGGCLGVGITPANFAIAGSNATGGIYGAANGAATSAVYAINAGGGWGINSNSKALFNTNVYLGTDVAPTAGATRVLIFGDNATDPTMDADTAGIYAKDVSGTQEMFAIDEADNAVQLTSHNFTLFDPPVEANYPWSTYFSNEALGWEVAVDMWTLVREVEKLSGKQLLYERRIPRRLPVGRVPEWILERISKLSEKGV